MEQITVRLDRVFDVVHGMHERKEVTFFGFQSGVKRVVGVIAPGKPCLAEGTVITVFLSRVDDWGSIVAWYNHSTNEAVLESAGNEYSSILFAIVMCGVSFKVESPYMPHLIVLLIVILAWAYWCLRSILFLRKIKVKLAFLKLESMPVV